MKRIAILTSGGDAPGMNATIRALVRCACHKGMKVFGVRRGFSGLLTGDFVEMDQRSVGNIIQKGGTILKTSRCAEFKTKEGIEKAVSNIQKQKFDGVVVIGGDGSVAGAQDLHRKGIQVVCLPGTIDNDLSYSDYSIGFDTAVNTIVSLVNNVRDTTEAHDRTTIVEVMGAGCGEIALASGIASGADVILVPEVKITVDDVCKKIVKGQKNGKTSCIIILNESVMGAADLAREIEQKIGVDARSLVVGHVQRGGSPSRFDRDFASRAASKAIEVFENNSGSKAIGLQNNKIVAVPIEEALSKKKAFDFEKYALADILSN